MVILSLLMVVLVSMVDRTSTLWKNTTGKIEQFREARNGFESITRRLSQATLNTYWDYDAPTAPTKYIRQSELRYLSGDTGTISGMADLPRPTHGVFFQAPLGFVQDSTGGTDQLENLLNTWGYFIEVTDDSALRPPFVNTPPKNRFRLMEMMEPSEKNNLYKYTSGLDTNKKPKSSSYVGNEWFVDSLKSTPRPVHVLAENIIALVLLPKLSPNDQNAGGYADSSLAPAYAYDSTKSNADANLNSKNQLPPVMQLNMVAVDEKSAGRMDNAALQSKLANLFTTASKLNSDLRRDATTYPDPTNDPSLEAYLINKHVNYRIFTTNISVKGAKWSREQKN